MYLLTINSWSAAHWSCSCCWQVPYRFNKDTVQNYIFPFIWDDLNEAGRRGHPIPPFIKLLTALCFYAMGSFQVKPCFLIITGAIVFVYDTKKMGFDSTDCLQWFDRDISVLGIKDCWKSVLPSGSPQTKIFIISKHCRGLDRAQREVSEGGKSAELAGTSSHYWSYWWLPQCCIYLHKFIFFI